VYRPKKAPVNVTFQISGELPEMATTIASRTTACGAPTLASKNGIGAAVFFTITYKTSAGNPGERF
jgi:hypothetical protein